MDRDGEAGWDIPALPRLHLGKILWKAGLELSAVDLTEGKSSKTSELYVFGYFLGQA